MSQTERNSGEELTQKQYNPADLQFADQVGKVIQREWTNKFKDGALRHGGIDKPAFYERKGMIKESLNEGYDLLSYLHNLDLRIHEAKGRIAQIRMDLASLGASAHTLEVLDGIISLLE